MKELSEKIRLPDDVTIGFLVEVGLEVPKTLHQRAIQRTRSPIQRISHLTGDCGRETNRSARLPLASRRNATDSGTVPRSNKPQLPLEEEEFRPSQAGFAERSHEVSFERIFEHLKVYWTY